MNNMAQTYPMTLVTPAKMLVNEQILEVVAPGSEGELGILMNHAPIITELLAGEVSVLRDGGKPTLRFRITGGYLHVRNNSVTLLADSAEPISG
jgi:F-type H+-transporting ATPase subunit epsilon